VNRFIIGAEFMNNIITIIPVHNGEKYLTKTLRSVACQTHPPDRLIVLDNCSTDGTEAVVKDCKDVSCEYQRQESNIGMFANFNSALEYAPETKFLHLLHADDVLHPNYYKTLIGFTRIPGPALFYSKSQIINESDDAVSTDPDASRFRELSWRKFIRERAELKPFYCSSVLLKTSAKPVPCRFRLDMPQLADLVFWAEWVHYCRQVFEIPEVLCQYRIHSDSGTRHNQSNLQSWVSDEWKAMQAIEALLDGTGFSRWIRQQKLKCIFAARSEVKKRRCSPAFASKIDHVARSIAGRAHFILGQLAVASREAAFALANHGQYLSKRSAHPAITLSNAAPNGEEALCSRRSARAQLLIKGGSL
jgi:glycosyltransferase involved in cell wall biosynthesis